MSLSGCVGTIITRADGEGSNIIGAYPYQAVYSDCVVVANPRDGGWRFSVFGVLSVPLDIVIDSVMLPFDLVAWPMGLHKNSIK